MYSEGGIFLKKGSIIILIIAILVIIAGVAIYMITNQNSTNNSSINLKTMIDTIYKNSNVELPSLETQKIGLSDNNVVSSYPFLSNNNNVEELVVSEPVMSSQAYSLVAIKLKDTTPRGFPITKPHIIPITKFDASATSTFKFNAIDVLAKANKGYIT